MGEFGGDDERLQHEAEDLMRQRRFRDAADRYLDLRSREPSDLWAALGCASALECAGDIENAQRMLDDLAERHGRSAHLQRFRHLFFVRREDLAQAAQCQRALRSAVDEGPEDQLADLYFNQGRYREAQAELERVERGLGADAEPALQASVQARLGACLRQSGEPEAARDRLRRALELEPDHAWTLAELAEAERSLGEADDARAHYRRALELNPDDHWTRGHLAQLEAEQGEKARAAALYEEILAAQPRAPWARVELAQVLAEDDAARAQALCREALELDPGYPWAHAQLGQLERRAGRMAEAREHLRRAAAAAPGSGWILHELADTCRHLGRWEEAYTHLEHARSHDPYDATTYGYMADLLRNQGRGSEAVPWLEKAVELDPGYAWAWRELAELRALGGDHAAGDRCYREACRADPDAAVNDGLRAFLLRCQGRRDAGLPWLERALERQGDYLWAWRELAESHLAAGRIAEAEAAAQRGLAAIPGNPPLLGLLAEALRRQGRRPEALEAVGKALDGSPQAAQLWAVKAEILAAGGDLAGADAAAAKAASLDAADEYRALRAQILIAAGRGAEAAALVDELIARPKPCDPAWDLAAGLAEERGDHARVRELCDRALAGALPGDVRLLVRRARAGLRLGEADAADRLLPLVEAAGAGPWREIAQVLAEAGRAAPARLALRHLLAGAADPAARARAWQAVAEIELALGDRAAARAAAAEAVARDPDSVPARVVAAVIADHDGEPQRAVGHLAHLAGRIEAAGRDPAREEPSLLRQLAILAERAGDAAGAESWWTRLAEADPDQHLADRAAVAFRRGETDRGEQLLAAVLLRPAAAAEGVERALHARALATYRAQGAAAACRQLAQHEAVLGPGLRALHARLALAAGDHAAAAAIADRALAQLGSGAEAAALRRAILQVRLRAVLAAPERVPAEGLAEAERLWHEERGDEEGAALYAGALIEHGRRDEALAVLQDAALPAPLGPERAGLLVALLLEERGVPAAIAAFARLGLDADDGRPQGLLRLCAAAFPGAHADAALARGAGAADAAGLPPFPRLGHRLAAALAAAGAAPLAAAVAAAVASAAAGTRPGQCPALHLRAARCWRLAGRWSAAWAEARSAGPLGWLAWLWGDPRRQP